MNKKHYILDTSALIADPQVFHRYGDSIIIIPVVVLSELDKLKKQTGDVGRNARYCLRYIDELSEKADISTGILLENNSVLKVDTTVFSTELLKTFGAEGYGDTEILVCAVSFYQIGFDVTLVSNDVNLKVKAKSRGLFAESVVGEREVENPYSGVKVVCSEPLGTELEEYSLINELDLTEELGITLEPNECIVFTDDNDDVVSYGRKTTVKDESVVKLVKPCEVFGIYPKNVEQSLAIDMILDKKNDLVTLLGKAGTGKSLIAIAAALDLVVNKKQFDKLVIYRPIKSAGGQELGFTPGTIEEKLAPWFQAIFDSFEVIFSSSKGRDRKDSWKRAIEDLQKRNKLEMDAITYVRGRSIPNSIIMVDEAQNMTQEDVKTLLTRAGKDSKVILTGDDSQIDDFKLDATNNGLTYVIDRFKGVEFSSHITLVKGERSRLAEKAAELL